MSLLPTTMLIRKSMPSPRVRLGQSLDALSRSSLQADPIAYNSRASLSLHPHMSLPESVGSSSSRSPSTNYDPSIYSHRSEEQPSAPTFFKSIKRAIAKAATAGSEPTPHHDAAKDKGRIASSSRNAGVKPKRSVTANERSTTRASRTRSRDARTRSSCGQLVRDRGALARRVHRPDAQQSGPDRRHDDRRHHLAR